MTEHCLVFGTVVGGEACEGCCLNCKQGVKKK